MDSRIAIWDSNGYGWPNSTDYKISTTQVDKIGIGGSYVAKAVYSSYDYQEACTLKCFWDYILAEILCLAEYLFGCIMP